MRFLGYFAIAFLLLSLTVGEARGYHVPPWDTGHNSFDPDPGDDGTDPGTDDGCNSCPCSQKTGSPVEVASGNFIYSFRPLLISGLGPAIDLTLTYNSSDLRRGPFGVGWVHPYEQRIVEVVDEGGMGEVIMYAICAKSNGKRERFVRAQDGSYISPPYVFSKLTKNADGTFTLRDKYGMVQRFNTQGLLTAIVDRNGNTLSLTYDATGFMTKITDASGRVVTFAKGADGRIESITDPANQVLRFGYDTAGNLTSYKDPLGNAHTYKYDTANNLTAMVDPRGNTQQSLTYDSARRVARHVEGAETWTYTYSPTQKRTIKRDSINNAWTYDYNENGNVTKITDPLGKIEQYVLDANFNVTQFTDKNGNITKYTYDKTGNQLTTTDAINSTRKTVYESTYNLPISVQDSMGNITKFEYDTKGNLMKTIDSLGSSTQFQYDSKGQLVQVVDALGKLSISSYDSYGNMISTSNPLGYISSATFDILGRTSAVKDREGQTVQYTYNGRGQIIKTITPSGAEIEHEYDAAGNLIAVINPNKAKTVYEYDTFNRLVRTTNPIGQITTYTYDRKGNLSSKTDPKGQIVTYVYDPLSRLIRKSLPSEVINYSYDGLGSLLSVTDNDSNLSFVYDPLSRTIEAKTNATSGQQASSIKYEYDSEGNRSSMTDPAGGKTSYVYDALRRLTKIKDSFGMEYDFIYDALSRRTKVNRPFATTTAYTYDDASRLTSLEHKGPQGNLPFMYSYDKVGNRLSKSETTKTETYTYNSIYQLTAVTSSTSTSEQYTYDLTGNLLRSHLSTLNTYDAANRLNSDNNFSYTYDPNGNLIQRSERATGKVTKYLYDSENQLTRIESPDGIFTFRYDGLGRRIEKSINGKVTRYIYDAKHLLFEYSQGSLAARYTYGPALDEVIGVNRNNSYMLVLADAMGSVIRIVDSSQIKASYQYDAFGRILSESGDRQVPHAFQGREYDQEVSLYYMRFRYYSPFNIRFLQEDPIGWAGGINFYEFAKNNPINTKDPLGLYGTNDCSYYDQRCAESGGDYYCKVAPDYCNGVRFPYFPKYPDPVPDFGGDFEGWTRCTRQCLQDCDRDANKDQNSCPAKPDPTTDGFWDKKPFLCHVKCYSKCAVFGVGDFLIPPAY